MPKDKRTGWLRELQVGDEVGVETRGVLRDYSLRIVVVEKITPTGFIDVKHRNGNTQRFRAQGTALHGDRNSYASLAKLTQEFRDKLDQARLSRRLKHTKWYDVPVETLREIASILDAKT